MSTFFEKNARNSFQLGPGLDSIPSSVRSRIHPVVDGKGAKGKEILVSEKPIQREATNKERKWSTNNNGSDNKMAEHVNNSNYVKQAVKK